MGRDHSCDVCGRGGFNDPDGYCVCPDDPPTFAELGEQAMRLTEALRATEWHREDGHGPPQCTVCNGYGDMPEGPQAGHLPSCIVGRALDREPGRGDPDLIAEAEKQAELFRSMPIERNE